MLFAALDDFYLTPEQLAASPSCQDGITAALESELRRYGADLIAQATVALDLPQVVACTSQVLFHRFYCKRSMKRFDVKVTAMAAFWLSCKLEEVIEIDAPTKLRLRDVLMVFHRVAQRRGGLSISILDPGSRPYDALKVEVVRTERHILRSLGFILHVEHPHHLVLAFAPMLFLTETAQGCEIIQLAWNFANDSLRTSLCLRYKAQYVACAALFLAARLKRVPLPEQNLPEGVLPWWSVIAGVDGESLRSISKELLELQTLPKAKYVCLTGRDLTSWEDESRKTFEVKQSSPIKTPSRHPAQGELEMAHVFDKRAGAGKRPSGEEIREADTAAKLALEAGERRTDRDRRNLDKDRRDRGDRDRDRRKRQHSSDTARNHRRRRYSRSPSLHRRRRDVSPQFTRHQRIERRSRNRV